MKIETRARIRAWWIRRVQWVRRHRFESACLALLAVLLIAAAVQFGLITFSATPGKGEAAPAAAAASASRPVKPASAPASPASAIQPPAPSTTASAPAKSAVSVKTEAKAAPKKAAVQVARKSPEPRPTETPREHAAVEPGVSGGFRWVHFGTAPYASSREEAMRTRESAFKALGLPEKVVTQLVLATDKAGEKTRINVGDHLDTMLSKGGVAHRNVTVAFGSPAKGMELAAPAEKWAVAWEGKTYTVLLPEVCNNWSSVVGTAPAPALPVAVTLPSLTTSSECPQGWTLTANAWTLESLPFLMRGEAQSLIRAAQARESDNARRLEPYKPDDVSRTLGRRLREEVRTRASLNADVIIRFIDPQTTRVVRELGSIHLIHGIGTYRFDEDPRSYVVETLWPQNFVSPATSAGSPRLRLFDYEWKGVCAMNEHGIVHGQ